MSGHLEIDSIWLERRYRREYPNARIHPREGSFIVDTEGDGIGPKDWRVSREANRWGVPRLDPVGHSEDSAASLMLRGAVVAPLVPVGDALARHWMSVDNRLGGGWASRAAFFAEGAVAAAAAIKLAPLVGGLAGRLLAMQPILLGMTTMLCASAMYDMTEGAVALSHGRREAGYGAFGAAIRDIVLAFAGGLALYRSSQVARSGGRALDAAATGAVGEGAPALKPPHVRSVADTPEFTSPHGEVIHELMGNAVGGTVEHSVAHVAIPPGGASLNHLHPVAEESYYILDGTARVVIGGQESMVSAGQGVAIPARSAHQIFNAGGGPLCFLAICVPAWTPDNTVFLK